MSADTILRPSERSASATPAVQLLRRRAFGKLVRVELAPAVRATEGATTR